MVYGPIAAFLVELFPTQIRYTSMSFPYHIGNGWFGGFLPFIVLAITTATGNFYAGLWYPIIVALMTFIIGTLFVRETKDADIRAEHGAQAAWRSNTAIAIESQRWWAVEVGPVPRSAVACELWSMEH